MGLKAIQTRMTRMTRIYADLAEASVVESQPSGCAAILRIAGHDGTPRPFNQATHALMAGNLPALRIGTGD